MSLARDRSPHPDPLGAPAPRLLRPVLIEDDDGDAKAVQRALRRAGIAGTVLRATDGEQGLSRLRRTAGGPGRACVILLDLRMPRTDGLEFLAALRGAVVFVLTTSAHDAVRGAACRLGVAGLIRKDVPGRDCAARARLPDGCRPVVDLPDRPRMTLPPGA